MIAVREIRILAPAVADAIAAGEVVERPAAVVKELCENSIDAGATRIDVAVEGGGLNRIVVSDDGEGISASQLELAVARHATSKLESVTDLEAMNTLGFRGEALASIAAVSEMKIVSCTVNANAGRTIIIRGGSLIHDGFAPPVVGTIVEVRDLFAMTPARLSFLKTPQAEAAAAVRVVAELALSRPEIAFTCKNGGRLALQTKGGDLSSAIRDVFGERAFVEMRELPAHGASDGEISVSGWISEPRAHRGDRNQIVLFVNGRRIHHRGLMVAIEDAYRGLLPVGRHPYAVVCVEMDPHSVDVNVHPAKREVRFRNERAIFSAVQRSCWSALQDSRLSGRIDFGVAIPGPAAYATGEQSSLELQSTVLSWPAATGEHAIPDAAAATLASIGPLQALGMTESGWIAASSPLGLIVVDPHAAHEKVLYRELRDAMESDDDAPSQMLLLDCVVEVDGDAALLAGDPVLRRMGYQLENFGPSSVKCRAVPLAAEWADPNELVREVLSHLNTEEDEDLRRHRSAAMTACHAATKLGEQLDLLEQQKLLDRLVHTPDGMTCPHGRPTVMVLDDAKLRRAFHRP